MSNAKIRLQRGFKTSIAIEGHDIEIVVARFTREQFADFSRDYQRLRDLPSARPLSIRTTEEERATTLKPAPLSDEAAARHARIGAWLPDLSEVARADIEHLMREASPEPVEVFEVDAAEIRRRRLDEMTPEVREAWERQKDQDDAFVSQFIHEAISAYVTVAPGQIVVEDVEGVERDVTSGEELARYFVGQPFLLGQIAGAIFAENTVPESLKNEWRSRSGSPASSGERDQVASGPTPVPIAANVESVASVQIVDATVSSESSPSGSTETLQ